MGEMLTDKGGKANGARRPPGLERNWGSRLVMSHRAQSDLAERSSLRTLRLPRRSAARCCSRSCRFAPKDFRQLPAAQWPRRLESGTVKGTRGSVPYRLPELLSTTGRGWRDRLHRRRREGRRPARQHSGLIATCNPGGAATARKDGSSGKARSGAPRSIRSAVAATSW